MHLAQPHTPLHTAQHRPALVTPEIVPGPRPDDRQHGLDVLLTCARLGHGHIGSTHVLMLDILAQHFGHTGRRQHEIDHAAANRRSRHPVVLGAARLLNHGHAAIALDGFQPLGAIGSGTGQNNRHGPLAGTLGQRTEREINRHPQPAWLLGLVQAQHAIGDGQVTVRRNDVNVIRFDRLAIHRLGHRHGGVLGHQIHHQTVPPRIQVGDQDECHAHAAGCGLEERLVGRQPASGRADGNDGRGARSRVRAVVLSFRHHHSLIKAWPESRRGRQ